MDCPLLRFQVTQLDGESIEHVTVAEDLLGDQLVAILGNRLGVPAAALALSCGGVRIEGALPLRDQRLPRGTSLFLTRLAEPPEHDGERICDACGELRFCHYGYGFCSSSGTYEPVIVLCEPCGGRPFHGMDTDSVSGSCSSECSMDH